MKEVAPLLKSAFPIWVILLTTELYSYESENTANGAELFPAKASLETIWDKTKQKTTQTL